MKPAAQSAQPAVLASGPPRKKSPAERRRERRELRAKLRALENRDAAPELELELHRVEVSRDGGVTWLCFGEFGDATVAGNHAGSVRAGVGVNLLTRIVPYRRAAPIQVVAPTPHARIFAALPEGGSA